MDTIRGERSAEAAEAQLERFITQRHDRRVADEGDRAAEEMWMESVARYKEREREQNRWEWVRFFDRMAQSHARISEDYEARAQKLLEPELEPEEIPGDGAA
jgi:hypothetical protein